MEHGKAQLGADPVDTNAPQQNEHNDDLDLDRAIADSLSSLVKRDDQAIDHDELLQIDQDDPKQTSTTDLESSEGQDLPDAEDNELEDAIGNVFDQFDFGQVKNVMDQRDYGNNLVHRDELREGKVENEIAEVDLSEPPFANSFSNPDTSSHNIEFENVENKHNNKEGPVEQDLTNDDHSNLQSNQDADELRSNQDEDLENAIGDAFANSIRESETKEANADDDIADAFAEAIRESEAKEEGSIDEIADAFANTIGDPPKEVNSMQESVGDSIGNAFANSATKSDDEDDALNDAIGNAFADAFGEESENDFDNQNKSSDTQDGNADDELHRAIGEVFASSLSNEPKELNLEDAIGNAFSNAMAESEPQEKTAEENRSEDEDLNDVIGNAFANALNEDEQPTQPTNHDDALNNAIGNALNSMILAEREESNDSQLQDVIGNALNNMFNPEDKKSADGDSYMDDALSESSDDLEEAIGNAFKSIMPAGQTPQVDYEDLVRIVLTSYKKILPSGYKLTESAIIEAFKSAVSKELTTEPENVSFNVSNVAQLVISEVISEDILPEAALNALAYDIANQVLIHLSSDGREKAYNIPQIDDNVLEHFENEAHKGDANKSSRAGNLEDLQMSDIMENAFNMAMDNPFGLIANMQTRERDSIGKLTGRTNKPPALATPSRTILRNRPPTYVSQPSKRFASTPALQYSGFAEFQLQNAKIGSSPLGASASTTEPKKKELSIAETLALHRSYMSNVPRRNYSSMESLDEALKANKAYVGPIRSQISSVINSITSRSGESTSTESNVLSAIKEMTNILTSDSRGRYIPHEILSIGEIISTYKGKEEQGNLIKSLMLAKNYLEMKRPIAADNSKASLLIDTVLKQFKNEFETQDTSQLTLLEKLNLSGLPNIPAEVISNISKSVVSAIASYSQSKRTAGKIKPKEFEDAKEMVRLENRARKKKWREENAERNKDNDLRSRVWKKANQMFGDGDDTKKKDWIEVEFNKRREKRMSRLGKPSASGNEDSKDDRMSEDVQLKKPLTDIFNLLSAFAHHEDPNVVLAATSAATASSAALYASNKNLTDYEEVESSITVILSSVIENSQSSGQHKRIATLSQGVTSFELKAIDELSITSDAAVDPSLEGISRQGETANKRAKLSTNINDERDSYTRIATNLDQIRSSLSSTVLSVWSSNSSLKIPQYKKPAPPVVKVENPTLTLPATSPFISNKANFGTNHTPKPNVGLRKPGSFQRPEPKKEKGKSLGFPQLLKTAFRQS